MNVSQQIQQVADATPTWANWTIMGSSLIAGWLVPIAHTVAIVWGSIQIYSWVEKRLVARRKRKEQEAKDAG